jgi:hypothetical protein
MGQPFCFYMALSFSIGSLRLLVSLSSFPETLSTQSYLIYDSIHRLALRYIAKDAVIHHQASGYGVCSLYRRLPGTVVFFKFRGTDGSIEPHITNMKPELVKFVSLPGAPYESE